MRTSTLLAAAAALVTLTGCTGGTSPTPPSAAPTVSPDSSAPVARDAGTVTVEDLGKGRTGAGKATAPQVAVCGKPALPAGRHARTVAAVSPTGHRTSVTFLDVDSAADAAAAVSDTFANCTVVINADSETLSWGNRSTVLPGGYSAQTVEVGLDGQVLEGTAVSVTPVDGDTIAVVVIETDEAHGAGTDRLSLYADKILESVLPAGSGHAPSPAPKWDAVREPSYTGGGDGELPTPDFQKGPEDTTW